MLIPEQPGDQVSKEETWKELALFEDLNGDQVLETGKIIVAFKEYLNFIRKLGKVDRVITISSPDFQRPFHMVGVFKQDGVLEDTKETVELVTVAQEIRWAFAPAWDVCISHVEPSKLDEYLKMIHSNLHFRDDLRIFTYPVY